MPVGVLYDALPAAASLKEDCECPNFNDAMHHMLLSREALAQQVYRNNIVPHLSSDTFVVESKGSLGISVVQLAMNHRLVHH